MAIETDRSMTILRDDQEQNLDPSLVGDGLGLDVEVEVEWKSKSNSSLS